MTARDLPLYPLTDVSDERAEGVRLLESDEECKTTAERLKAGWRVVDWEVADFDGRPHWFARCWHTIPDRYVAMLSARMEPQS